MNPELNPWFATGILGRSNIHSYSHRQRQWEAGSWTGCRQQNEGFIKWLGLFYFFFKLWSMYQRIPINEWHNNLKWCSVFSCKVEKGQGVPFSVPFLAPNISKETQGMFAAWELLEIDKTSPKLLAVQSDLKLCKLWWTMTLNWWLSDWSAINNMKNVP